MLIFACLIALMGLLLNSPAVIIGAMLISPLMGPILACGLALTIAEWSLGKKSVRNLVLSVVEVVLIATIATHLSPLREATPEILARTNPNLMDLLIARYYVFHKGRTGGRTLLAYPPAAVPSSPSALPFVRALRKLSGLSEGPFGADPRGRGRDYHGDD